MRETNNHTVFNDSLDCIIPDATSGEMLVAKCSEQQFEYLLTDITVRSMLKANPVVCLFEKA